MKQSQKASSKGHWTKEEVSLIKNSNISNLNMIGCLTIRCSEKAWRQKLEENSR